MRMPSWVVAAARDGYIWEAKRSQKRELGKGNGVSLLTDVDARRGRGEVDREGKLCLEGAEMSGCEDAQAYCLCQLRKKGLE